MTKLHYKRLTLLPILLLSLLSGTVPTTAQTSTPRAKLLTQQKNTLNQYTSALDSLTTDYRSWRYQGADSLSNPYYFYLFSAPTFFSQPVHRTLGTLPRENERTSHKPYSAQLQELSDRSLLYVYAHHPALVAHSEGNDGPPEGIREKALTEEAKPNMQLSSAVANTDFTGKDADNEALEIVIKKPNFWTFAGSGSLQLMQSHYSDNWYKGGESNFSILGTLTLEANYNKNSEVTFDNKFEAKLGFNSTSSDEVHKFKTSSDLLRLTDKFGIQATKRWYYTIMLQSWTQFYPTYSSNSDYVKSDFMSPFESVFSIGMDYKYSKGTFSITGTFSPLALDMVFVSHRHLATTYGVDAGQHFHAEFGSTATINISWNPWDFVKWTSRIYYYTDYSDNKLEWENTIALTINKYLSTNIFLYPRLDTTNRDSNESIFEFYEYISLGFNYSF